MLTMNGARSCFTQQNGAAIAHTVQMTEVKIRVWNKSVEEKINYNERHLYHKVVS
jgi:hypothetical protein